MTGKRIQTSPAGSPSPENISDASSKDQDRFLPIANVSRIMKKSLPANAKISKEAKETVQECVSEFISFITGEASDKCQREKRKTINGDDLLWAMTTLGFENYVGPLKVYLNRYRETEGEKNPMASRQEDNHHGINGIDFHGGATVGEISKPSTSSLQGFSEDDCYGKGYGENLVVGGGFTMGRIHPLGDGNGNGNRAMPTHLRDVWGLSGRFFRLCYIFILVILLKIISLS